MSTYLKCVVGFRLTIDEALSQLGAQTVDGEVKGFTRIMRTNRKSADSCPRIYNFEVIVLAVRGV